MKKQLENIQKYNPIIFYDGDCGFCNSVVQFVLKRRKKDFYFAALQSESAKELLAKKNIEIKLDTIYFISNEKVYNKSSAALQICKGLKGIYPLAVICYIFPKFIRDVVYDFIAKRRHKLKSGFCAIPQVEEKKFFLS